MGRKLAQNKICVAIARELCGFVWDVARQVKISQSILLNIRNFHRSTITQHFNFKHYT
jgi:hypothetical protein